MKTSRFFLLVFASVSALSARGGQCVNSKTEYIKLKQLLMARAQRCIKSDDCILVFDGPKQNPCDLGDALSKSVSSPDSLSKLNELKNNIDSQCPRIYMIACAAMPRTKAVCKDRVCVAL